MVSGVSLPNLWPVLPSVARKHFRRVGESCVDLVYNLGRRRVIFDIAEVDVKFLLRPGIVRAGAAFVVLDPPEFVHLTIEIISGIGKRKSFDGDSRRVLQAVRHVYADAAVRVTLESVRAIDVHVDVSDAHVYYSVIEFKLDPIAVDHLIFRFRCWRRAGLAHRGRGRRRRFRRRGRGSGRRRCRCRFSRMAVTVRL